MEEDDLFHVFSAAKQSEDRSGLEAEHAGTPKYPDDSRGASEVVQSFSKCTEPPVFSATVGDVDAEWRQKLDAMAQSISQSRSKTVAHSLQQRQGKVVYYANFCLDTVPASVRVDSIQSSDDVAEWPLVSCEAYLEAPLPEAREVAPARKAPDDRNCCFNCGSTEHTISGCTEQRDEEQIRTRRRLWERERAAKAPWANEPRYFAAGTSDRIAHVRPGELSPALCAALGIPSDQSQPPPYLAAMVQEGYPPGYVDMDEGRKAVREESEQERFKLKIFTGGEDMELSDNDDGGGGGQRSGQRSSTQEQAVAVQAVVFPGAFGAPLPSTASALHWDSITAPARAGHGGEPRDGRGRDGRGDGYSAYSEPSAYGDRRRDAVLYPSYLTPGLPHSHLLPPRLPPNTAFIPPPYANPQPYPSHRAFPPADHSARHDYRSSQPYSVGGHPPYHGHGQNAPQYPESHANYANGYYAQQSSGYRDPQGHTYDYRYGSGQYGYGR